MPFFAIGFLQLCSRSEKHLEQGLWHDSISEVLEVHLTQDYKFRIWICFKIFLVHSLWLFHFINLVQLTELFDLTNSHLFYKTVWKETSTKMGNESMIKYSSFKEFGKKSRVYLPARMLKRFLAWVCQQMTVSWCQVYLKTTELV